MTTHETRGYAPTLPRPHVLRLGAVFPPFVDPVQLPPFAARMEQLGFHELWVIEDCFLSGGFTAAATALAATRELRIGLGLIPATVRNPAIAAMEIATLARLHPYRFAVTLGRGVPAWMSQIGVRSAHPLDSLGATVSAITSLLGGKRISVTAEYFALDDVQLALAPDVIPPVLVGTTGPRGLALAGQIADGIVLAEGCVPSFVKWAVDVASPRECVVYAWLSIDNDPATARGRLFPAVQRWFRGDIFPRPREFALPGAAEVRESDVARLSVCGDARTCANVVRQFADAGTSSLIFYVPSDQYESQLELFAREVMPLLQSDSLNEGV